MQLVSKHGFRKIVDELSEIRCAVGSGLIREEVWQDADDHIARYNLAFINHYMTSSDNGRVLGYDNSHGHHHRHFKGRVELFDFVSDNIVRERFSREVRVLRKVTP